jgi:hypothetical protein
MAQLIDGAGARRVAAEQERPASRSAHPCPWVILLHGELLQAVGYPLRLAAHSDLDEGFDEVGSDRERARIVDTLPLRMCPYGGETRHRFCRLPGRERGEAACTHGLEPVPTQSDRIRRGDRVCGPPLRLIGEPSPGRQ